MPRALTDEQDAKIRRKHDVNLSRAYLDAMKAGDRELARALFRALVRNMTLSDSE